MNMMLIFDVVIILLGLYMTVAALRMKKSGKISTVVLAQEEIKKCKDTQGFISFLYWKEAAFGGMTVLVGIFGLLDGQREVSGIPEFVRMLVFLAAFFWFQNELRKARSRYCA